MDVPVVYGFQTESMMNMVINLTHKAATFAYDLDFTNLPADVLTVARRCVLDGLAVALAGSEQPVFDILHRHLKGFGGSPQARVIGDTNSSLPPPIMRPY